MFKQKVNQFNDYLAERMSLILSMMVTFWVVLVLVIVPLFYGFPTTVLGFVSYLSCSFFQAIALPVLGYTSKKASDKSDKLMEEMYRMTADIKKIVEHLEIEDTTIETELKELLSKVHE